jgi:hypothetical protein
MMWRGVWAIEKTSFDKNIRSATINNDEVAQLFCHKTKVLCADSVHCRAFVSNLFRDSLPL